MSNQYLDHFFQQWRRLSISILTEGTLNLSESTLYDIYEWQEQANLLGLHQIRRLCQQLASSQENSQSFKKLLSVMQAMEIAYLSQIEIQKATT